MAGDHSTSPIRSFLRERSDAILILLLNLNFVVDSFVFIRPFFVLVQFIQLSVEVYMLKVRMNCGGILINCLRILGVKASSSWFLVLAVLIPYREKISISAHVSR